jgi:3-oxoadipate enol-lactonase
MRRAKLVGRERHEREEGPERQEPGEAPVTSYSPTGIAYDRAGPRRDTPVVLLHAGVADRRMWDPQWPPLTAERDVVRLDLRGFGDSTRRPEGPLSGVDDVIDTLAHLDIERCHFVGASLGAGVAIEVALTRPELVDSLLLSAPGGSLVAQVTPDLRAFIETEGSALAADDLDGAVEANLAWWVAGPQRDIDGIDARIRNSVGQMQRRAFELTADWDDVEEKELQPSAIDRLGEIRARTLILVGALDLDAISVTADRVTHGIYGARRIDWPNTAHLPSMERPADFLALLQEWLRARMSG